MTADIEPRTATRVPVLLRVAAVLAVLLALMDVLGAVLYWPYAPLALNVAILVISALTIVGAIVAWRGVGWGVWLAAITRVLSIAMSLPAFLDSGVPADVAVTAAIQDVITVAAIIMLLVGLARRRRA